MTMMVYDGLERKQIVQTHTKRGKEENTKK